jgi:hypothetical protein
MAPPKHTESSFATTQLSSQLQMSSFASEPAPAVFARPNQNVDWNALMIETEIEWAKTLEYLGR